MTINNKSIISILELTILLKQTNQSYKIMAFALLDRLDTLLIKYS